MANISDKITIVNASYAWHIDNSSTVNVTSTPRNKLQFDKAVDFQYVGVTSDANCSVNDTGGGKILRKSGVSKQYITIKGTNCVETSCAQMRIFIVSTPGNVNLN